MSKDIIEIECTSNNEYISHKRFYYEYIINYNGDNICTYSKIEKLCLNFIYPVYIDPIGKINRGNVTWKLEKINNNTYRYNVIMPYKNEETNENGLEI